MTHYYYYIEAGQVLDETARFFQVAVGTSKQANRDYLFLVGHAVSHGHYFEVRNMQSSEFFEQCLSSISGSHSHVQLISARDLVRNIKRANAQPLDAAALHSNHQQRNYLDINYRVMSNLNRDALSPAKRRNV